MGTHLLELDMNVIQPIVATLLTLFSILLIQMGFQWNEELGGIHPMIAYPGAILSSLCALIVLFTEDQYECEHEEEDWEK